MLTDLRVLDTQPGAGSPASPPEGWNGDGPTYRTRLLARAGKKTSAGQLLLAVAHHASDGEHGHTVEVIGPYAEEAREVLLELGARADLLWVPEDAA